MRVQVDSGRNGLAFEHPIQVKILLHRVVSCPEITVIAVVNSETMNDKELQ